jgi:tripartite-type tricarboxylate transporter receptor subunit TctC
MIHPVNRRGLLAGSAALLSGHAHGQAGWAPTRPVRIVVAWPPGGGVDTPVRLIAAPMQQMLGQPVVVENRGGASGSIGAAAVAQASADGHTLLADASPHAANASLMRGLSFDYATAFAPLTQIVVNPLILVVHPSVPAQDVPSFVTWLKAEAQPVPYASSGIGTAPHQAAAVWLQRIGATANHVPYRGGGPAMTGLLSGDTRFMFSTLPAAVPLVQEGRLRALAVATAERLPNLPNVPTVAEQGLPGFAWMDWIGLWAPAGTPDAALQALHAAALAGLRDPAVEERLGRIGQVPLGSTPAAFGRFVADQRTAMADLVRTGLLTAEN